MKVTDLFNKGIKNEFEPYSNLSDEYYQMVYNEDLVKYSNVFLLFNHYYHENN